MEYRFFMQKGSSNIYWNLGLCAGIFLFCIMNHLTAQVQSTPEIARLDSTYKSLLKQNNKPKQLEEVALAYKVAVKQAYRRNSPSYANALERVAKTYLILDDYKNAEKYYQKCLKSVRQQQEDVAPIFILEQLANVYQQTQEKERYLEIKTVIDIKLKVLEDRDSSLYYENIYKLGKMYWEREDWAAAENYYVEAKALIDLDTLSDKELKIRMSNEMYYMYRQLGDFSTAELLRRESIIQALKLMNRLRYPELQSLLEQYRELKDYESLELLCLVAKYSVYPYPLDRKHLYLLNELADNYVKLGDYAIARLLYLEAARSYRDVYGEASEDYIRTLDKLAGLHETIGRKYRAKMIYHEALKHAAKLRNSPIYHEMQQKVEAFEKRYNN
ncbi:MAG: tetratricopeptide repeat protein [Saprospiraceae bacterium]|nr:tetratricopeptide repeat protein [Saprospiraceae bacterium]